MAAININVGSAANANDGDTLRAAFQATRQMFHEIYGISTTYSDSLDLSTGTPTFQESVEDIVGAMFTSNSVSNITSTYTDNGTGAGKIDLSVAADITDINTAANSGLDGGVDSGDATLTLDLNNLAAAAVDVSADSIAIIDANDSNGTRKESIADLATAMAGTGLSASNGQLTASGSSYTVANQGDNRVVTSVDSTNGNAEANLTFDGSALGVTGTVTTSGNVTAAGNGTSGGVVLQDGQIDIKTGTGAVAKVKFYCESSNAHAQTLQAQPHSAASSAVLTLPTLTGTLVGTGDSGTVATAMVANNAVTHDKLENRYTAKASSSATGNQNLDCSAATTFLLTGNIATATLTLQNLKLGQVVDIVMSGTLSSADITLATDFTSATIRKVGSASLDTSTTNVIQVVCIDDDDSAALVHYSINTFATDITP
tara:strand:- start:135 stop:1421 length:1287 start_codon:yes stop_codon:yes gene_type:complete